MGSRFELWLGTLCCVLGQDTSLSQLNQLVYFDHQNVNSPCSHHHYNNRSAGRIFLQRLIDLSTTARLPHHHISLNAEARRDVTWWLKYLPLWNGRAIIPDPFWSRSPDLELFTDASGGLGFGIYFQGHWLNGSWPSHLSDRSIQWKELYHIALACLLWGPLWRARNCYSTVITNQSWTFGQRVLPVTPSLCTLFVQSSFALHPTNSLSCLSHSRYRQFNH